MGEIHGISTINNVQAHKAYTEKNTIQTWSSKYGKRESHKRRDQR